MRWSTLLVLIGALAWVAVLAGCGDSKEEKAKDKTCTARDDIAKQVKELQGLTITTATTSQVKDSLTAIRNDLSQIADAQGDLSDERRTQLEDANQKFAASVRQTASTVATSTSIEEAKAKVKTAFDELATTYKSTLGKIDCS